MNTKLRPGCDSFALEAVELGYGTCWIGAFNEDELKKILSTKPPGVIVYLRSDEKVEYGYVIEVIGHMRRAGVKEIGLVAEILQE